MATPLLAAVVTTTVAGLVVALATAPVLRRLPEPVDGAREGKVPYPDLATFPFVLACAAWAVLAEVLAWALLPAQVQPLWTVLALCAVLLAVIDARTTWLPLPLTRVGWLLMAVAAVLTVPLGASAADLLRTGAGGAAAGLFYLVVWLVTRGGFGFGDVRYAPLLGAATAGESWTLLLWGLTLGTVVGAVHAAVRLARRLPGGFPYAPSMLAGVYLAALLLHVSATG
jgi:leader peptidase (prepilin peptidase)/N-methyltransferase